MPTSPPRPPRRLPRTAVAALAAAVAAALLAACSTVGPDYKRPPAEVPPAWRTTEVGDAAGLVDTSWWEAFGDPELSALVQQAIEHNRDLQVAIHQVEQFQAMLQVSNAQGKPQVGYQASGNRLRRSQETPSETINTNVPEFNSFSLGLKVDWEIDLWGRIKRANEAALADLMAAKASQRGVMLTVVSSVATGYVQVLGLDRELATARLVLDNRQRAAALLEQKQKGGSATTVQVERARAEAEQAAEPIPDIERQIAAAENALSLLTGRNPGPVQRRAIEALRMPAVPQGLPSDLLARRPDIEAAEQALVAANARIGVAKGEYFPTISLTGALGLASDDLRWLFAKTARTGNFSRGLLGTIFSAGRIEGTVAESEAVEKQMVERYLQSIQTGLQEVDDALTARARSTDQARVLEREVQARQRAESLSRQRFEGGQATLLEVLDDERDRIAAQGRQAQNSRDQFVALVSIYKAMGGGWMAEQDKLREAKLASAAATAASAPGRDAATKETP